MEKITKDNFPSTLEQGNRVTFSSNNTLYRALRNYNNPALRRRSQTFWDFIVILRKDTPPHSTAHFDRVLFLIEKYIFFSKTH